MYSERLAKLLHTPVEAAWAKHVFHMYVVRTSDRDRLQARLGRKGISTGIHYPLPIHRQPIFSRKHPRSNELRVTNSCAETVLSLPMHPGLNAAEVEYICDQIEDFFLGIHPLKRPCLDTTHDLQQES
jgi:dTDP-4-amino-4,6-dideoxygalactose transaminase